MVGLEHKEIGAEIEDFDINARNRPILCKNARQTDLGPGAVVFHSGSHHTVTFVTEIGVQVLIVQVHALRYSGIS